MTEQVLPSPMIIILPYPPAANKIWRSNANARGIPILSAEYRKYKTEVLSIAKRQGIVPIPCPVELSVIIRIYRPRRAGDLDGRIKALLDSLNKLAWTDDAQVVEIHAYRHDDKTNPRAEIEVRKMSDLVLSRLMGEEAVP